MVLDLRTRQVGRERAREGEVNGWSNRKEWKRGRRGAGGEGSGGGRKGGREGGSVGIRRKVLGASFLYVFPPYY
jgi:hypothetical protein